uniref:Uncharacterized protein n=1 Tax=Electrophorus electricus TaxID=8005 RepID=A0A4W4EK87_ELEEL
MFRPACSQYTANALMIVTGSLFLSQAGRLLRCGIQSNFDYSGSGRNLELRASAALTCLCLTWLRYTTFI